MIFGVKKLAIHVLSNEIGSVLNTDYLTAIWLISYMRIKLLSGHVCLDFQIKYLTSG